MVAELLSKQVADLTKEVTELKRLLAEQTLRNDATDKLATTFINTHIQGLSELAARVSTLENTNK